MTSFSMNPGGIKQVVVAGGGTAGWMTACALATVFRGRIAVTLLESSQIGTVGVGEATIPMIQRFNQALQLDEADFLRRTNGSFKLGIEFVNWGAEGERYMHAFGRVGQDLWQVPFEHHWRRMRAKGRAADLGSYSITRMAALANKFMPAQADPPNSPIGDIAHAYHFDASAYALYLREVAESRGVTRLDGEIEEVETDPQTGRVAALRLRDQRRIEGQLFIDCTGFSALLLGKAMGVPFVDWSHWLPCDRAWAVPCESVSPLTPYTRATARDAGWQWRIPLQHRIGNGHVFCSAAISEDEAAHVLLQNLDGKPLADPRLLRFRTGMRESAWHKNVVGVGLASGFLEPLESTSIHLIQATIQLLIDFFPDSNFSDVDIEEFNRQNKFNYESVRDFVILHYRLNRRPQPFWRKLAEMSIPETLQQKLSLYKTHGRIVRFNNELFSEVAWLQVMEGQGWHADSTHPLTMLHPEDETAAYLEGVREVIARCVDVMPDHAQFIGQYCRSQ